ncbi:sensor histidine kinase, partial [Nonomuraea rhizosphaerae]|uniref:sensor histidine kinase n=1 Tax=Nonomuraea rhizosphaerae TaxID=2665663 RepID=UPI001C605E07
RMRRNSENLLVLAGQDPPRRWSQPVKLVDVARASLSEVENYERVVPQVPDGVSIAGQAVNDIIHLLAELVENALSFSPRDTRVTVSGSRIDGGGVMLSITDSGIGMTREELAQANERLLDAPIVDVSVSRRMGLFVVARLAHRHGIRVQLRPHGSGGLTAMVLMPENLLATQPAGYVEPRMDPPAYTPPQWQGDSHPMGPAHPSYPSYPSTPSYPPSASSAPPAMAGAWSSAPSWPSDGRMSTGGYDTGDVWTPVKRSEWNGEQARRDSYGFSSADSHGFPSADSMHTGPLPAVKPDPVGDEYLPIYAAVESAWFEHGGESAASWSSVSTDAGWNAARAAVEPVRDGTTGAGLPKRVPKANLVPGSAKTAAEPQQSPAPMPPVSADRVRSRLSNFQQGCRAARDDLSTGRPPADPPSRRQNT